jgi:hypothetical protein
MPVGVQRFVLDIVYRRDFLLNRTRQRKKQNPLRISQAHKSFVAPEKDDLSLARKKCKKKIAQSGFDPLSSGL